MSEVDLDAIVVEQMRKRKERDGALSYLRTQLHDVQNELNEIELQRSVSEASAQLAQHPAWQKLMREIRDKEKQAVEYLRNMENPEMVSVAKAQAYLRAIRLITLEPLEAEALAQLESAASMRRRRITDLRNLLPK
jgi:ATP-dependent Lon protease